MNLCLPKVGQLLYRGCACDEFASVLEVGEDPNGLRVMSIQLIHDPTEFPGVGSTACCKLNDLYYPRTQHKFSFSPGSGEEEEEQLSNLAYIDIPDGVPIILRRVPWEPAKNGSNYIHLAATTGGCYSCTEVFWPHDEGAKVDFLGKQ